MEDSLVQGLAPIVSPALADLLLLIDESDSYAPTKMSLEQMRDFVLQNEVSITTSGGYLKLLRYMNANSMQIKNLANGTADGDAVNYGQVKEGFQSLGSGSPGSMSIASEQASYLRLAATQIINPWGGFYLFYWCVDTYSNTTLSVVGANVVASSGAAVNFDGSVGNIVNVIKDSGWVGKYFHVAFRYRNLKSITGISGTEHRLLSLPSLSDVINADDPAEAINLAVNLLENRLYITAETPAVNVAGVSYMMELLFDNETNTDILGTETGLIKLTAPEPVFTYDLPISLAKYGYAHVRILSRTLNGYTKATDTKHHSVTIDGNVISDSLVAYIAARVAEKVVTNSDESLKVKP